MRVLFYLVFFISLGRNLYANDDIFNQILEGNPEINKSYNEYLQVIDKSKQILSKYLPQISLNYKSYKTIIDDVSSGDDDNYTLDDYGVELNQVIYEYGVSKILESSKFKIAQYKNKFYANISNIFVNTVRLTLLIDTKYKELSFLEKNYEIISKLVDITTVKYNSGSVNSLDLLQAKTELMDAKNQIIQLKRDIRLLESDFFTLTSVPYAKFEIAEINLENDDFNSFWQEIKKKNYNILASSNQIKISKNSVDITKKDFMPQASVFMSSNKIKGGGSSSFNKDRNRTSNNIGFNISVPLYKGGYNVAKLSDNKHNFEILLKEDQNLHNNIKNEAVQVYENILINDELVNNQKLYLEFATSLVKIAETNYKYGRTDLINLLEAQREYNKASYELTNVINLGKYYNYKYLELTGDIISKFPKIDVASIYKNL